METVMKADIFFFITTIAVVLFTAVLITVLYFVLKLVRVFTEISEIVRDEAQLIKDDIDGARDTIRSNAEVVGTIIGAFVHKGAKKATSRTKSNK